MIPYILEIAPASACFPDTVLMYKRKMLQATNTVERLS